METKTIETKGKKVNIWKMNFGFKTDYQGATTNTTYVKEKDKLTGVEKTVRKVNIDNGKTILMTLVYGIFSAPELNIPEPKYLDMGFTPEELEARIKAVRVLGQEVDTDIIYEEINKLNTEVEEEILVK